MHFSRVYILPVNGSHFLIGSMIEDDAKPFPVTLLVERGRAEFRRLSVPDTRPGKMRGNALCIRDDGRALRREYVQVCDSERSVGDDHLVSVEKKGGWITPLKSQERQQ